MKKINSNTLLFTLLATFLWGFTPSATAQQSVSINGDSIYASSCPIPAYANVFIYGTADNYNSATDSIEIEIFWGDGTSDAEMVELSEGGTTDYFQGGEIHNYTLAGTYQIMIVATTPNNLTDTMIWGNLVNVTSFCTQFDGYTYEDLNSNCTFDATDTPIPHATLKVEDANGQIVSFAASDVNGYYSLSLPTNLTNLTITSIKYPAFSTNCPVSGSYIFNSSTSQTFDFAMECSSSNFDKFIHTYGRAGAPGDTGYVYIYSGVRYCSNLPQTQDTITIELDSHLTYLAPMPWSPLQAPNQINGNELIWYTSWINTLSNTYAYLPHAVFYVTTDTNASLFDTVCNVARFASQPNDVDPTNDVSTTCLEVGGPYDPNNKLSFPQGTGPEGYIDTSIHHITYRINFQNTGTAPAQNVYVLDTITSELILSSIELISSSHSVKLIHQQNNRVRFDFQNINLPDSASDPGGSQGYVEFRIQRDPSLPIGTEIKNRVGIYFDYNAPIVTNYAVNTLYDAPDEIIPVEIEWTTSDVTCIENNNGNIELSIESGTPPYSYAWSNGSTAQNQYDLAPGNYSVTVSDSLQQSASAQIEVGENRVHPAPVLGEITGPLSVLANNSYSYEVEHSSGSSYTWIVQGGELINAANNVAEIMWFEGPQGELEITEKDLNGCMGNTEQTITINTVGIIENSMKGLSVYPNPSDGLLNVSLPNLEGEVSIQLFDVQGQLVLHHSTNDNQTSLNIAHLDAGVYLLSIKHDGESAMLRLIVN